MARKLFVHCLTTPVHCFGCPVDGPIHLHYALWSLGFQPLSALLEMPYDHIFLLYAKRVYRGNLKYGGSRVGRAP